MHNTKLDTRQMSVRESLKVGSFLKNIFKNTTFKSVLKESLPISCSLKWLEYRACFNISTRGTVILSRLFFRGSFMAILNEAICTIKAQKLQQCEVRRPGQTLCCLQREAWHLGKHCSPMICHQLWKPAPTWSLLSAHKRKCLKLI